MRSSFIICVLVLISLSSCQTFYTYHLPTDSDKKRFPADSLKWGYSGSSITSIPAVDADGKVFRLHVTPKTKIEVKSTYGELLRFYLQTIKVTGDEGMLGANHLWTGYDLLTHSERSILVQEVLTMQILSDEQAIVPISRP